MPWTAPPPPAGGKGGHSSCIHTPLASVHQQGHLQQRACNCWSLHMRPQTLAHKGTTSTMSVSSQRTPSCTHPTHRLLLLTAAGDACHQELHAGAPVSCCSSHGCSTGHPNHTRRNACCLPSLPRQPSCPPATAALPPRCSTTSAPAGMGWHSLAPVTRSRPGGCRSAPAPPRPPPCRRRSPPGAT